MPSIDNRPARGDQERFVGGNEHTYYTARVEGGFADLPSDFDAQRAAVEAHDSSAQQAKLAEQYQPMADVDDTLTDDDTASPTPPDTKTDPITDTATHRDYVDFTEPPSATETAGTKPVGDKTPSAEQKSTPPREYVDYTQPDPAQSQVADHDREQYRQPRTVNSADNGRPEVRDVVDSQPSTDELHRQAGALAVGERPETPRDQTVEESPELDVIDSADVNNDRREDDTHHEARTAESHTTEVAEQSTPDEDRELTPAAGGGDIPRDPPDTDRPLGGDGEPDPDDEGNGDNDPDEHTDTEGSEGDPVEQALQRLIAMEGESWKDLPDMTKFTDDDVHMYWELRGALLRDSRPSRDELEVIAEGIERRDLERSSDEKRPRELPLSVEATVESEPKEPDAPEQTEPAAEADDSPALLLSKTPDKPADDSENDAPNFADVPENTVENELQQATQDSPVEVERERLGPLQTQAKIAEVSQLLTELALAGSADADPQMLRNLKGMIRELNLDGAIDVRAPFDRERLRDARNRLGLSQRELGDRLGILNQSISYYETGEQQPSPEAEARIMDWFNEVDPPRADESDKSKAGLFDLAASLLDANEEARAAERAASAERERLEFVAARGHIVGELTTELASVHRAQRDPEMVKLLGETLVQLDLDRQLVTALRESRARVTAGQEPYDGERQYRIRTGRHMTLRAFAELVDITHQQISQYERGTQPADPETRARLEAALNDLDPPTDSDTPRNRR